MIKYSTVDPRTLLPEGDYYIGDPCYVIRDEEWMDCLEGTLYFNLFSDEESMKAKGHQYAPPEQRYGVYKAEAEDGSMFAFCGSTTKYGDGCYPCFDEDGYQLGTCGVDAGLISAIPIAFIEKYGEVSGIENGVKHTFKQPFRIQYSDYTGKIYLGDVEVMTGDEDEWNEDYDY